VLAKTAQLSGLLALLAVLAAGRGGWPWSMGREGS